MAVSVLRKWAFRVGAGETGLALPVVLALLTLGGLFIAPSLDYTSTNVKAGQMLEKRTKALYTAEAGVRDALWRLKTVELNPMPYSFDLTGVNGMSASVIVEAVTTVAGETIGATGIHGGWLRITRSTTYAQASTPLPCR